MRVPARRVRVDSIAYQEPLAKMLVQADVDVSNIVSKDNVDEFVNRFEKLAELNP